MDKQLDIDKIFHALAELDRNVELPGEGGRECRLQIATMDDPKRRAIAMFGVAKRHTHDFASGRGTEYAQRRRCDRERAQPILKPEINQNARGIGRELEAGAGFLEPLGLFQYDDAKTVARERERGGQSADAGAGNDDHARGRQGTPSRETSDSGVVQGAFRRPRGVRRQRRVVATERRAIRADVLGILAHVAIDVRVIERRHGADAHELLGADIDDRNAEVVMEVRNDCIGHARLPCRAAP